MLFQYFGNESPVYAFTCRYDYAIQEQRYTEVFQTKFILVSYEHIQIWEL